MEKIIITNATWFRNYLIVRRIVLVIVGFAILLMIQPELVSDGIRNIVQVASISFLVALLIFEFVQRPTLFELRRKGEKLRMGLYFPDSRYFINFCKSKIKYFDIHKNDAALFKANFCALNLLHSAEVVIAKRKKGIIRFKNINLSWASKAQINKIKQIIKKHSRGVLVRG